MFKSSIAPRIPLSAASSSGAASSSMLESEDVALALPPPPPPPPPLPHTGDVEAGDSSIMPASLPLPPPPPMPPKPAVADLGMSLPPPPLPLPPPGPPPKEQVAVRPPLPPPPPLHQSTQPPPPGTAGSEMEKNESAKLDNPTSKEPVQASTMLPPPPPPPGLPLKLANNQSEGIPSESDAKNTSGTKDLSKAVPPPPPPRQQPPPGSALVPTLQPDVLPPGISRFPPPPPPPDMRPPLAAPGLAGQPAPPGMMVPLIPRPPFGPPPGPPPMMRPPLPPGPPPISQDDHTARLLAPQKPSYVKSAASTVVKKPLAQHTPELTAMVPASVRVRRETTILKAKPKPSLSTVAAATMPVAAPVVKPESVNSSSAPKTQSIDDSYTAFLEDMKALGALDG
uniref:Putative formin-like protein 5 n=1 Tax=Davidia involucrata TaxID=16924 RepID=A0A5B7ABQ5_DAVIN